MSRIAIFGYGILVGTLFSRGLLSTGACLIAGFTLVGYSLLLRRLPEPPEEPKP